jgi:hypothetical protein
VARQAAHLFAVLAAALGIKFEAYAITFMSAVYKGLVITVQVRCNCVSGPSSQRPAHTRTRHGLWCIDV